MSGTDFVRMFRDDAESLPEFVLTDLACHVENAGEMEITPMLEAISVASLRADIGSIDLEPMKEAMAVLWKRYINDRSEKPIGNRPGIMARIIEISGRIGYRIETKVLMFHPYGDRVLYQLIKRPLEFMSPPDKLVLYADVMSFCASFDQGFALKHVVIDIVGPYLRELAKRV